MPGTISTVDTFPADKVMLLAVNQEENRRTIQSFLDARAATADKWKVTVGLDRDGKVGEQFQVEAIPQTVIIAPGGKIARVHVGAHSNLAEKLKEVLTEMLAAPADSSSQPSG